MWNTAKTYLYAAVAAVLGVLSLAVTILTKRNRTLKDQRDDAREHADHAVNIIQHDIRVEELADQAERELQEQLENEEPPEELIDPNKDWQI
jgi:hypothetical protein